MQKPFFHAYALKPEILGATLRQRREQLGYTLTEMEVSTGISKKTIIKIEKGGDAKFSTISTLLSYMGLTLDFSDATKELLARLQKEKEDENYGWY